MDKEAIKAAKKAAQEEKRLQKKLEQAEKAYERDLKKAFSGQGFYILLIHFINFSPYFALSYFFPETTVFQLAG